MPNVVAWTLGNSGLVIAGRTSRKATLGRAVQHFVTSWTGRECSQTSGLGRGSSPALLFFPPARPGSVKPEICQGTDSGSDCQ